MTFLRCNSSSIAAQSSQTVLCLRFVLLTRKGLRALLVMAVMEWYCLQTVVRRLCFEQEKKDKTGGVGKLQMETGSTLDEAGARY